MSKVRIEKGYWDNGDIKHEIPYQNNQRHGVAKYWCRDGQLGYEHYWLYGKEVTEEEYHKHILIEKLACLKQK